MVMKARRRAGLAGLVVRWSPAPGRVWKSISIRVPILWPPTMPSVVSQKRVWRALKSVAVSSSVPPMGMEPGMWNSRSASPFAGSPPE